MTRPVRHGASWLLLLDVRGDSTPATFSHPDGSSRFHRLLAETPITPSVQELHEGLQSFPSMRRMEAKRKKASALTFRFSQSLASLRHRSSQAIVRSAIKRFGGTTKPLAWPERLTISMSSWVGILSTALSKIGPWQALPANSFFKKGNRPKSVPSRRTPPPR